jgi:hypothetical protein
MKMTASELREIKSCLNDCEKDLNGLPPWLKKLYTHSSKMYEILTEIRESVHGAEDAGDFCMYVAEKLGTNCDSNKDIDG